MAEQIEKSSIQGIVTHESPDLDAILCVWLLKRYGAARYPGIADCPVTFVPAGNLPEQLSAETLERTRGILAVDTGGGRLDTHSQSGNTDPKKQNKSAASLVAEDLNIAGLPELEKLLSFVTAQETSGRSIASQVPMDHLVSLPNLLRGLNLCHPKNPQRVLDVTLELLDAALATERDWFIALEDYKFARTYKVRSQARMVAIVSDSSAALKVCRLNRADLIIHRNGEGHTGITPRNGGALDGLDLSLVAAVLRTAEADETEELSSADQRKGVGLIHGWYLHDSLRILSKGSRKNRQVSPSKLSLEETAWLVRAALDSSYPLPQKFCCLTFRGEQCQTCAFLPLKLEACDKHRMKNYAVLVPS